MIAVDTSALIAILFGEAEAVEFVASIQAHGRALIGAPTELEFRMVALGQAKDRGEADATALLEEPEFQLVPFDTRHLEAAADAFQRFGKGWLARAKLNYGDCMAYAIASVAGCPLLFKGSDLIHTGIVRVA